MAHVRRRGKRKDGSWRWEARMPDPSPRRHPQDRANVPHEAGSRGLARVAARLDPARHVHRRAPSASARSPMSSTRGRSRGRTGSARRPQRRYQSIIDKYLVPEFGTRPDREDHARARPALHQPALSADPKRSRAGTVRNVYAVLRTACAKGVRLGMLHANPVLGHRPPPRPPRRDAVPHGRRSARGRRGDRPAATASSIYTAAYTGCARASWPGSSAGTSISCAASSTSAARSRTSTAVSSSARRRRTRSGRSPSRRSSRRCSASTCHDLARRHRPGGVRLHDEGRRAAPARASSTAATSSAPSPAGRTDAGQHHPGALPERLHGLRFHDLRHTCAALSIAAGAHPKLITARLGHSLDHDHARPLRPSVPVVEEALADALDAAFTAQQAPTLTIGLHHEQPVITPFSAIEGRR